MTTFVQKDDLGVLAELQGSELIQISSRYLNRLGDFTKKRIFHTDDLILETSVGLFGIFGSQEHIETFGDEFGIIRCERLAGNHKDLSSLETLQVGHTVVATDLISESLRFINGGVLIGTYAAVAGAVIYFADGCLVISKLSHNTEFIRVEFLHLFELHNWAAPRIRYEEDETYKLERKVSLIRLSKELV